MKLQHNKKLTNSIPIRFTEPWAFLKRVGQQQEEQQH